MSTPKVGGGHGDAFADIFVAHTGIHTLVTDPKSSTSLYYIYIYI